MMFRFRGRRESHLSGEKGTECATRRVRISVSSKFYNYRSASVEELALKRETVVMGSASKRFEVSHQPTILDFAVVNRYRGK